MGNVEGTLKYSPMSVDPAMGLGPRTKQILVVEDHKDLNRSLSIRLEKAGFWVTSAPDGLTGWDEIERTEPDLVILDLHLPRLHGLKVLHRIRASAWLPTVPVIVLTGDRNPMVEERALKLGARKVLHKPIRQKTIVRHVVDLLDGKS